MGILEYIFSLKDSGFPPNRSTITVKLLLPDVSPQTAYFKLYIFNKRFFFYYFISKTHIFFKTLLKCFRYFFFLPVIVNICGLSVSPGEHCISISIIYYYIELTYLTGRITDGVVTYRSITANHFYTRYVIIINFLHTLRPRGRVGTVYTSNYIIYYY